MGTHATNAKIRKKKVSRQFYEKFISIFVFSIRLFLFSKYIYIYIRKVSRPIPVFEGRVEKKKYYNLSSADIIILY